MSAAPILSIRSLSMRFGGLSALSDVSFDIPAGRTFGLIGPNGAGKTTLFNCLAGIYAPSAGHILYSPPDSPGPGDPALKNPAMELAGRPAHAIARLGLARTYQNIRLFGSLSVLDNVRIGRHGRTRAGLLDALLRPRRERREEQDILDRAVRELTFVGLARRLGAQASTLPYGDQRRLEIARALAAGPKLILLDEPAAGLNPQETAALVDLIQAILARNVTVLLIEHDMKLVMRLCQGLAVLDHGQLIATGTPDDIRHNDHVIQAYLGSGARHA